MSKEAKILVPIALLLCAGFIFLIIQGGTSLTVVTDKNTLVKEGNHMTGKKDAKVVIVEFGDYQCPACAAAHPIVKQLLANYQKNPEVSFVFRNFPLPMHQNALIAAETAEAAGAQGKFWEMHDILYEHQSEWENSSVPLTIFSGYAQQLGLHVDTFQQAVQNSTFAKIISDDQSDGQSAGVDATPTFYINGKKLVGVPARDELKNEIDTDLK